MSVRPPCARRPADPGVRLRRVRALPTDGSTRRDLLAAVHDPSLQVARAALRSLAASPGEAEGAALAEQLLAVDPALVSDCARAVARLDRATGARLATSGLHSPAGTGRG